MPTVSFHSPSAFVLYHLGSRLCWQTWFFRINLHVLKLVISKAQKMKPVIGIVVGSCAGLILSYISRKVGGH